jgi:hypothetical protein
MTLISTADSASRPSSLEDRHDQDDEAGRQECGGGDGEDCERHRERASFFGSVL